MSGRKRGLGPGAGPGAGPVAGVNISKRNYRCKVPGCSATPRGCDVPRHYKRSTDWLKVRELKLVVGSEALERELEQVDGHTRFAFVNKYTEKNLPTWVTHAPVPVAMDPTNGESSGTGPKQSKLSDHFQVKIFVKRSSLY